MKKSTIELTPPFKKALEALENSTKTLFISGKAGTGKSTLLDYFRKKTKKNIVVLAPTGVAALNVEGETIHSFFRFSPTITVKTATAAANKQRKRDIFHHLEIIIIDEISMVRADLLDAIDAFLKTIRKTSQPFGGVQMVFIGDLYQLPPVVRREDKQALAQIYTSPYFFDSQVMQRIFDSEDANRAFEYIELEKIYRQKDPAFVEILNATRTRTINEHHIATLNQNLSPEKPHTDLHIHLATTNAKAQQINDTRLRALKTKAVTFEGEIEGDFDTKSLPTEIDLTLKKGARVMFVHNDRERRWVNGTLGTVTGVDEKDGTITVQMDDGFEEEVSPVTWDMYRSTYNEETKAIEHSVIGSFTQLPVRLAWAITIHKSQGKTFERVIVDLERGSFAHGQTYVALSRCTSLDGLVLTTPVKKSHVLLDYHVVNFITQMQYDISEREMGFDSKVSLIQRAITESTTLAITYLKKKDEKSARRIVPKSIGPMTYQGKEYIGLQAYCLNRKADRVFRVDRILELSVEEGM